MTATNTVPSLPVLEDIMDFDEKLITVAFDPLDSLFGSVTRLLIDSYENETVIPGASWEYVGRFTYEVGELVHTFELLLKRAKDLHELCVLLARTAQNDGRNPDAPALNAHYGQYAPSPEALRRWEMSDAKERGAS